MSDEERIELEGTRNLYVAKVCPHLHSEDSDIYMLWPHETDHPADESTTLGELPLGTLVAVDVFRDDVAEPVRLRVLPWNDNVGYNKASEKFITLTEDTRFFESTTQLINARH